MKLFFYILMRWHEWREHVHQAIISAEKARRAAANLSDDFELLRKSHVRAAHAKVLHDYHWRRARELCETSNDVQYAHGFEDACRKIVDGGAP